MRRLCGLVVCFLCVACGADEFMHEGTLEPSDHKLAADGSAYDWVTVDLEAGDSLTASVRGEGFDPTLFVFSPSHKQLSEKPGHAGKATIHHQASVEGSYSVMINALEPDATGSYVLKLEIAKP